METIAATSRARPRRRVLPKGWRDFGLQLALFAVVDVAYELSRTIAEGNVVPAFVHARDVVHVERDLGIFSERSLQHWTLEHSIILDVANWTYFHAHFGVTVLFMFWLYLRRNRYYYFVRNIIFASMAIALVGYILFPTAPPRMLTNLGFIDTLEKFSLVNHDSGAVLALSNPFAAVPSIHTCFSVVIGLVCFLLVRNRVIRVAWLGYPGLIVFSIVATANHFWLDAILGLALAVLAFGVAWLVERQRPTLPAGARRRMHLRPVAAVAA
jgi:PAP2 superfamily